MGFLDRFRRSPAPRASRAPNPWASARVRGAGFTSGDVDRLLSGWDNSSNSIDFYLHNELRELRARSRKMVRANPYGKRFIATIKSNVVGPSGVGVQAQSMRFVPGKGMELDTAANDAIEAAWREWAQRHCDYFGRATWVDLQNLALSCAGQDGEFLFEKVWSGPHGFQLKVIDPELLDVEKNTNSAGGRDIRLGVEYDQSGRVVRYHFHKRNSAGMYGGGYQSGERYSLPARNVIHGFIAEWPDQSRGIPWMHSSLERSKHLEKYDEAAIVNARLGASRFAVLSSEPGNEYTGDEEGTGEHEGATLDTYEPGTIKDIGNRKIQQVDTDYPHQMYAEFVKSQLRGIASGLGVSYHSLSNDLQGVNYSSIRAGVLEDREIFKGLQNWFIRSLVQPVYEEWLSMAYTRRVIRIGTRPLSRPIADYMAAHFQPRRWAWVDPQKDGMANQLAMNSRLKSPSQLMREQGDDPESVWREWARDRAMMESLGIAPVDTSVSVQMTNEPEKPDE